VAGVSLIEKALEQAAMAKHPSATQVAARKDFPGKVK